MKKPTQFARQFEKEVKRLQKLITQAKNKGIEFIEPPIPTIPKRITKQSLQKIHSITFSDILNKGYTRSTPDSPLQPYIHDYKSRKRTPLIFDGNKIIPPTLTPKTRSKTIKQLLTPEQRAEISRTNLAKAREARQKKLEELRKNKPPKQKFTPEQRAEISRTNLAKAREARLKKLEELRKNKPPKQKLTPEQRAEISRTNLAKAREAHRKKQEEIRKNKPPKHILTDEEKKKIRQEAARKAAQTRKQKMQTDEEYRKRIQETARKNLAKARAQKETNKQIEELEELPMEAYVKWQNILNLIEVGVNTHCGEVLTEILNDSIDTYGFNYVIKKISEHYETKEHTITIMYASVQEQVTTSLRTMAWLFIGTITNEIEEKILSATESDGLRQRRYYRAKPYVE